MITRVEEVARELEEENAKAALRGGMPAYAVVRLDEHELNLGTVSRTALAAAVAGEVAAAAAQLCRAGATHVALADVPVRRDRAGRDGMEFALVGERRVEAVE